MVFGKQEMASFAQRFIFCEVGSDTLLCVVKHPESLPVWDSGWLRVAGESLIRWVVPGDPQLAS